MANEQEIRAIVERVMEMVKSQEGPTVSAPAAPGVPSGLGDGIFETLDEALTAARASQKQLLRMSKAQIDALIASLRKVFAQENRRLAEFTVRDTKMGYVPDKMAKNQLILDKTPGTEDLEPRFWSGDGGITFIEYIPYGVVGSITPSTNPGSTVMNHAIGMVAGRNTVFFAPHPGAIECTLEAVRVANRAIKAAGGPPSCCVAVAKPTLRVATEMMRHPGIDLLVVTGGGAVVRAALETNKKAICAGPGNPPVIVDETADLDKAGKYINIGAAFDNNMPCICEKELYVVRQVADALIEKLQQYGAYLINDSQTAALAKVVLTPEGHPNKEWVGKDAHVLLQAIGITVPAEKRLIITEVAQKHPFVMEELLMPILPIVRVNNFEEAVEKAIEAEHGFGHTGIIHSRDISRITAFGRAINTALFVANSHCGSALGFEAEGPTTMTIAGTTGEGVTTARSFCKPRRVAVRNALTVAWGGQ